MYTKKYLVLILIAIAATTQAQENDEDSVKIIGSAEVRATRWDQQNLTPATTIIKTKDVPSLNTGMDLPQMLQSVPSLIYSSDAGNNIGYTSMKIRGSDATRINVTINGVPYNDAESQGTFFVDIADIISSTDDVLITNGIGSSTNGTGALGASVNISTALPSDENQASILLNRASYNTSRATLRLSTGRLGRYKSEIRLSSITSDGYIERSSSKLNSWLLSQYLELSQKHILKLITFGGTERTEQAWNGIPIDSFESDPRANYIGQKEDGSYYDDQTDNYKQQHGQLFLNSQWTQKLSSSIGLYTSIGKGYYEEYKRDQSYANYGLPDYTLDTTALSTTSLIRQLWLDNILMGINTSLEYDTKYYTNILGASYNNYNGNHYGTVIWAQQGIDKDYQWYDNDAVKSELNLFDKFLYRLDPDWVLGIDLQYRQVSYRIEGFRDNPDLVTDNVYRFFNPKISVQKSQIQLLGGTASANFYTGYANKEPIRSDFESSVGQTVSPESLLDIEASLHWNRGVHQVGIGLYGMYYTDQLILTGKLNDVGAYTRQNVDKSRRLGVELQYQARWKSGWYLTSNAAFSLNKIDAITVYYDDYDTYEQMATTLQNTDISYSPNRIAYLELGKKNTALSQKASLSSSVRVKALSKQYLDNTQNPDRLIPSYTTVDLVLGLDLGTSQRASVYLSALNLLNTSYFSNGYTFSYIYGGSFITENYVYPQARFNYNLGLQLGL